MNIKIKYGPEKLIFKLPKGIKLVNNLPGKLKNIIDIEEMRKIIHLSLINNLNTNINFENRKIVIIIEDMSRPTFLGEVLEIIIEKLLELGAELSLITIISASGAHRPMSQNDFKVKIGTKIVSKIKCISNNCESDRFSYLGKISKGIPIFINEKVVEADTIITVSTIFPHDMAGFSGGAKMILPGVANLNSITDLHRLNTDNFAYANNNNPEGRCVIEDVGKLIKIDLCISLIINEELEIINVYPGDYIFSQRKAAEKFIEIYGISDIEKTDVVISNCYPLGLDLYQIEKGLFPALLFAKDKARILFISDCKEGVGFHRVVDHKGYLRKFVVSYFKELSKKYDISFFSNGVSKYEFEEYFSDFHFFNNFDDCISYMFYGHETTEKNLSLLRASPLIAPKIYQ